MQINSREFTAIKFRISILWGINGDTQPTKSKINFLSQDPAPESSLLKLRALIRPSDIQDQHGLAPGGTCSTGAAVALEYLLCCSTGNTGAPVALEYLLCCSTGNTGAAVALEYLLCCSTGNTGAPVALEYLLCCGTGNAVALVSTGILAAL